MRLSTSGPRRQRLPGLLLKLGWHAYSHASMRVRVRVRVYVHACMKVRMYVYRAVFLGERAGGSCQTSWKWCRALLARCHRRLRPHPMPAKISREMLQLDRMAVSVLQRRAFRVPCMTRCTWLGSTRTRLCKQLGVGGCASWFAIGDPLRFLGILGGSCRDVVLGLWSCSRGLAAAPRLLQISAFAQGRWGFAYRCC